MVDALLVFSPLQEICFFVLRAPYLDQIGVAPLLRRRLFGLQSVCFSLASRCISLLVSPSTSPRPVSCFCVCSLRLAAPSTFHLQVSLPSALRLLHQFLLKLLPLRRSVPTV
jgi:hypothetical protein